MPSSEQILAGLTAISNRALPLAVLWTSIGVELSRAPSPV